LSARSCHEHDEEPHRSCAAARHHTGAAPRLATSLVSGRGPPRPYATPPRSDVAPPTPDLDRLLTPPPALPRTTPPELQWGEKEREREREKGRGEKKEGRKSRKREEKKERRKEKERERKKKINYLFIENIISKLYCLLFFW
jgi:hypothetical protein